MSARRIAVLVGSRDPTSFKNTAHGLIGRVRPQCSPRCEPSAPQARLTAAHPQSSTPADDPVERRATRRRSLRSTHAPSPRARSRRPAARSRALHEPRQQITVRHARMLEPHASSTDGRLTQRGGTTPRPPRPNPFQSLNKKERLQMLSSHLLSRKRTKFAAVAAAPPWRSAGVPTASSVRPPVPARAPPQQPRSRSQHRRATPSPVVGDRTLGLDRPQAARSARSTVCPRRLHLDDVGGPEGDRQGHLHHCVLARRRGGTRERRHRGRVRPCAGHHEQHDDHRLAGHPATEAHRVQPSWAGTVVAFTRGAQSASKQAGQVPAAY